MPSKRIHLIDDKFEFTLTTLICPFLFAYSQFCQHAPGHHVSIEGSLIDYSRTQNELNNLCHDFSGIEGGMQVVRKGSSSEYPLRFIHAIDNGTRINRSMAIRSIGLAARYAQCRSAVTQSVNIAATHSHFSHHTIYEIVAFVASFIV